MDSTLSSIIQTEAVSIALKNIVDLLNAQHVAISMTERGDPYENALAERMNGIIKEEFNLYSSQENFENTYQHILKSVIAYNEIRPHGSCDNLTPCQAHKKEGELKKDGPVN